MQSVLGKSFLCYSYSGVDFSIMNVDVCVLDIGSFSRKFHWGKKLQIQFPKYIIGHAKLYTILRLFSLVFSFIIKN